MVSRNGVQIGPIAVLVPTPPFLDNLDGNDMVTLNLTQAKIMHPLQSCHSLYLHPILQGYNTNFLGPSLSEFGVSGVRR